MPYFTFIRVGISVVLKVNFFITARKRSLGQGNIFTPVCHSVHGGGACMVALGGHAWLPRGVHGSSRGSCMVALGEGVHGCSEGCMVASRGSCMVAPGGHAWLLQGVGGMCGSPGGHAWLLLGVCMVAPGGHAWLLLGRTCVVALGGMHGCSGGVHGCSRRCAWLLPGGMCGCSQGMVHGCSWGDMHGIRRDREIQSMSGRYASYWNAFLCSLFLPGASGLYAFDWHFSSASKVWSMEALMILLKAKIYSQI